MEASRIRTEDRVFGVRKQREPARAVGAVFVVMGGGGLPWFPQEDMMGLLE